jgi:glycosyltransferase involved in cell wall biosynthesis
MTPERERPTLLVLASTYPRWAGDPEPAFVHELSRRLVGRFRVIVLCPHAPDAAERELLDGVEVIRYRYAPSRWERLVNDGGIVVNLRRRRWMLALVPGFVLAQLWTALRVIRRECVDVIHAHWLLPQGLIAALAVKGTGRRVPFLVTSHGADLFALKGRALDAIKRYVARRAAAVAVVSATMKAALADLGIDQRRVVVRSMGVDFRQRFTPDPQTLRSASQLLFVGRLVEKKGLATLIAALPAIVERYPEVELLVAGSGPEEAALRDQVRTLGLDARVRFLGAVSQQALPALYRQAALFVAPFVTAANGDQEGLGLVVLEALGCGCPVLVGDVPALRDLPVTRVASGDREAWASAVVAVLDDPAQSRRIAAEQREACIARFDWESVAEAYTQMLDRIAAPGSEP